MLGFPPKQTPSFAGLLVGFFSFGAVLVIRAFPGDLPSGLYTYFMLSGFLKL